ncbi:Hypp8725 [Branchiostoma lanceolatum]|uniref:Hypp8725 protein n=1 Tax=Branchiostoma lanceolatum TaxID=7740 RepID=A0A8J9Z8T7_BRALA|nr:Hypp8725 [Branchiostoma lanceolatum]
MEREMRKSLDRAAGKVMLLDEIFQLGTGGNDAKKSLEAQLAEILLLRIKQSYVRCRGCDIESLKEAIWVLPKDHLAANNARVANQIISNIKIDRPTFAAGFRPSLRTGLAVTPKRKGERLRGAHEQGAGEERIEIKPVVNTVPNTHASDIQFFVPASCTGEQQPLDCDGGVNDVLKKKLKQRTVQYHADKFVAELREGRNLASIKIELTQSKLKPLHAKWLLGPMDS